MHSARFTCHILIKLENSLQIFDKSSNIKFYFNICLVGTELFSADRRTDRLDEASSRNFENAPRKLRQTFEF
jgi:hypothetical protein